MPVATLVGEWNGMIGLTPTAIPNVAYYFNIRLNGTMKVAGTDTSSAFGDSTYTAFGDTIKRP